jgi:hypothetical protein
MSKLQSSTVFGKSISRLHYGRKIFNLRCEPFVPGIDESPIQETRDRLLRDTSRLEMIDRGLKATMIASTNKRPSHNADILIDTHPYRKPSKRMPSRPLRSAAP